MTDSTPMRTPRIYDAGAIELRKWAFEKFIQIHGSDMAKLPQEKILSMINDLVRWVLLGEDARALMMYGALSSDNPTIVAAVDQLEILMRLDQQ